MDQFQLLLFAVLFIFILILFVIALYPSTPHHHHKPHLPYHAGDIKLSIQPRDHDGWILCDGRSLERSLYPYLFEIIGTSFGSLDTNSFTLPDMRGRVPGAIGQGANLTNRTIGDKIGEERHTMTLTELVSHTHTGTTNNAGNHTHTGTTNNAGSHTHTGNTDNSGSHTHSSNASGGQGNFGLAKADGTNTVIDTDSSQGELNVWRTAGALTINSDGTHQHSFTTASVADHQHSFTTASVADHQHTFTTQSTGSTTPFNVMQPTLFVGNTFIYSGDKNHHHSHPTPTPH